MDLINKILQNYPMYLESLLQLLGSIVVILSIFLRIKPSSKGQSIFAKLNNALDKAAQFFPTLGINPRTKELQDWAEENMHNFPELKKILRKDN
jgi:hypothetical protein